MTRIASCSLGLWELENVSSCSVSSCCASSCCASMCSVSSSFWTTGLFRSLLAVFAVAFAGPAMSQVPGYPAGVEKRMYVSGADGTEQPTLFWKPAASRPDKLVPLLVALHTWSGDYTQAGGEAVYAEWCQQAGWVFLHPNFRGRNRSSEALGSELAAEDILSAVEFARSEANVDTRRIYCIGVSGGGHMSLMMAGRAPKIWAGVSAWCGISDIEAWHEQCAKNERFVRYANEIEQAVGGDPAVSASAQKEAMMRSPLTWLERASEVPLDINHGLNDGRAGSVPFTHSLRAWNRVVENEDDRLSRDAVQSFYQTQQPPEPFMGIDPHYGKHQPVFRRVSGNQRITIFDGGHEIVHRAALTWLAAQQRPRPVEWSPKARPEITLSNETESGR